MGSKKINKIYEVSVKGESMSDWRAATPEDIKPLIEGQTNKPTASIELDIIKKQVELLLNQGDTALATEALQAFTNKTHKDYPAPVCRWRRDLQNGRYPFMGGHSFFGAFRDAANYLYPEYFYQKGKKGFTTNPSRKHLRKFIRIMPHHVYFHDAGGGIVAEPSEPEGQQPVGEVRGFAYYEAIRHPFSFQYTFQINPKGKLFDKFLSNTDEVIEAIKQSAWFGQGGCRGAGYGGWNVTKTEISEV
jgi:hypothetical protein